jgi:hypothetical protein
MYSSEIKRAKIGERIPMGIPMGVQSRVMLPNISAVMSLSAPNITEAELIHLKPLPKTSNVLFEARPKRPFDDM